ERHAGCQLLLARAVEIERYVNLGFRRIAIDRGDSHNFSQKDALRTSAVTPWTWWGPPWRRQMIVDGCIVPTFGYKPLRLVPQQPVSPARPRDLPQPRSSVVRLPAILGAARMRLQSLAIRQFRCDLAQHLRPGFAHFDDARALDEVIDAQRRRKTRGARS